MIKILLPNEKIKSTWNCIYNGPNGSSNVAKLLVTQGRIIIKLGRGMKFGSMASQLFFIDTSSGLAFINKSDIKAIEIEKAFMANKCIVTISDDSKHSFEKRVFNPAKMADAIKENTNLDSAVVSIKILKPTEINYSASVYNCCALFMFGLFCYFKKPDHAYQYETLWDYLLAGLMYICFGAILIISSINLLKLVKNYKELKSKKTNWQIAIFSIFFLLFCSIGGELVYTFFTGKVF